MEKIQYYPLGSIVQVTGQPNRLMIVSRALQVKHPQQGTVFFDYGGVEYPGGLVGAKVCYFNHDTVENLVFRGFEDEANERVNEAINAYVQAHPELKRLRH